jgi:hypothetical protein
MGDVLDDVEAEAFLDTIKVRDRTKGLKKGFSRKALHDALITRGFSEEVTRLAVDEYARITDRRNYQDRQRMGLLFACVLKVYKEQGVLFDLRSVAAQMRLEDATMSQGIRRYCEHVKILGEHVDTLDCSLAQYVRLLMSQLARAPSEWCLTGLYGLEHDADGFIDVDYACLCLQSILDYLGRQDVCSETKNSTPRCVAAASIHFYLVARGCTLDKAAYADLCGCASVSIDKYHHDIASALKRLLIEQDSEEQSRSSLESWRPIKRPMPR